MQTQTLVWVIQAPGNTIASTATICLGERALGLENVTFCSGAITVEKLHRWNNV
jgi:hypothetical protein